MPPFKILLWPNPILREVSLPADLDWVKSTAFKDFIEKMTGTLLNYRGIGLAAVQVGHPDRVFVMHTRDGIQTFVNPVVRELVDDAVEVEESCLSLPGVSERVMRHPQAILAAYNFEDGGERLWDFYGIEAQCVQHEIDHLDGKMISDGIGPVKKDIIRRKMRKAIKFNPAYEEHR